MAPGPERCNHLGDPGEPGGARDGGRGGQAWRGPQQLGRAGRGRQTETGEATEYHCLSPAEVRGQRGLTALMVMLSIRREKTD